MGMDFQFGDFVLDKTSGTLLLRNQIQEVQPRVFNLLCYLVENAGVQVNAGHHYGMGGSGRMRMNLATSRKLIEKALDNIGNATRRI